MCSKPLAAFNGLAQKRDEFTKQLVNLKKNNEKINEEIPEMEGLAGIKGKVAFCAQGVKDKNEVY